jgi:hypothetical protein
LVPQVPEPRAKSRNRRWLSEQHDFHHDDERCRTRYALGIARPVKKSHMLHPPLVTVSRLGLGNLQNKIAKERFNESRPLSLVFDMDKGRQYDLWIGCKTALNRVQSNMIRVLLSCCDYNINSNSQAASYCNVMPNLDINAIVAGKLKSDFVRECFLQFDRNAAASGSGMMQCLRGANRSGLVMIAFLMARFKLTTSDAIGYLKELRPIVDISQPARGCGVFPVDWLARNQRLAREEPE